MKNVEERLKEFEQYMEEQRRHVESILQGFQKDLIASQGRQAFTWNAMNAVLQSFLDRGLITSDDVVEAGKKLMDIHRENIAKAQSDHRVVAITQFPLDMIQTALDPRKKG